MGEVGASYALSKGIGAGLKYVIGKSVFGQGAQLKYLTPAQYKIAQLGVKTGKKLRKTKSTTVRALDIYGIERIPKDVTGKVSTYLKNKKMQIYGSAAQQTQVLKKFMRTARDIDVGVSDIRMVQADLYRILKTSSEAKHITKAKGGGILYKGQHMFDIKHISRVQAHPFKQAPIEIGGHMVIRLSEQTMRKSLGMWDKAGGKFYRMFKDLPDFESGVKTLIKSSKESISKGAFPFKELRITLKPKKAGKMLFEFEKGISDLFGGKKSIVVGGKRIPTTGGKMALSQRLNIALGDTGGKIIQNVYAAGEGSYLPAVRQGSSSFIPIGSSSNLGGASSGLSFSTGSSVFGSPTGKSGVSSVVSSGSPFAAPSLFKSQPSKPSAIGKTPSPSSILTPTKPTGSYLPPSKPSPITPTSYLPGKHTPTSYLPPTGSSSIFTPPQKPPIPIFFKLDDKTDKRKRKSLFGERTFKRTPSLIALGLKLPAKKRKKGKKQLFTGLEIRGVF